MTADTGGNCKRKRMRNIAIFASGAGTNAENIIKYFSNGEKAKVALVLSNKPDALVLERAARYGVESFFFDRALFYNTGEVLAVLEKHDIDIVVLAGFLWLVPENILKAFAGRIVNIHPALLPRHGGRGMYGGRVHGSVLAAGDRESGITIHLVNERYDSGDILFQARCPVVRGDTPDSLAARVHALEYEHYPRVIEEIIDRMHTA